MLPTGVATICHHMLLQYHRLCFLCRTFHHHDSYTYSWLLFWHTEKFLENSLILLSLSINLLGGTRAVLSVGLTLPHYSVTGLLCTPPSSLCILRCFSLPVGKKHYFWPCVWPRTVISNPFRSFINRLCWSILIWVSEGTFCGLLELLLCSTLSFLCTPPALDSGLSALSPEQEVCWVYIGCTALISSQEPLSSGQWAEAVVGFTIFVSYVSSILPCLISIPKTVVLCILSVCFVQVN